MSEINNAFEVPPENKRKSTNLRELRIDEEVVIIRTEEQGLVHEPGKVLSFTGSEQHPTGVSILARNGRIIDIKEK